MIIVGQNNEAIKKARELTNEFSGFMAYISINDLSGLNENTDFGNDDTCLETNIDENTKIINVGVGFDGDAFDEIPNGKYDDQIDRLDRFFAKYPDIVFYIRPAYECEIYWYKMYCPAFVYFSDRIKADNALICLDFMDNTKKELCYQYTSNIGDKFDVISVNLFGNIDSEIIGAAELSKELEKPLIIGETCPIGFNVIDEPDRFNKYLECLFAFCRKYKPDHISYIADNWTNKKIFANAKLFNNTDSTLNKRRVEKLFSFLKKY